MILGIHAFHHDSSVALTNSNRILFASHEERFSRTKFDRSWPSRSIHYVLKNYDKPEAVAFHGIPSIIDRWSIKSILKNRYGITRCEFIEHHESHAYSSIVMNNWEPGAVLVIDAKGGKWATSYGFWDGKKIHWDTQIAYPNSLGLFYSAATKFLGFTPIWDEQKVMSAAMYGNPVWVDLLKEHIIDTDKDYFIKKDLRRGIGTGVLNFDIAASVQAVLEETVLNICKDLANRYSLTNNLYYSGGVALNCVLNTKIKQQTNFENIYIQPSSGDAGGALGASAYLTKTKWETAFLGLDVGQGEDPVSVAKKIVDGEIVAVINGKAEFGPRALGNRSYLCLPTQKNIDKLNTIKGRGSDSWRPYAPVCRYEDMSKYFESIYPSFNMMFVTYRKPDSPWYEYIDQSARLQVVTNFYNSYLYSILTEVAKKAPPVLLNTSLNAKGKPIVNTRKDYWRECLEH